MYTLSYLTFPLGHLIPIAIPAWTNMDPLCVLLTHLPAPLAFPLSLYFFSYFSNLQLIITFIRHNSGNVLFLYHILHHSAFNQSVNHQSFLLPPNTSWFHPFLPVATVIILVEVITISCLKYSTRLLAGILPCPHPSAKELQCVLLMVLFFKSSSDSLFSWGWKSYSLVRLNVPF